MNEEDWTLVQSNKHKRIKKNLEKDINNDLIENKFINKYPEVLISVNHDTLINNDILNDTKYLDYIYNTYFFNRDITASSRLLKIDKLVIKNLGIYFIEKDITVSNYNKISYSNNIKIDNLDSVKLVSLLNIFRIRGKNNNVHIIIVYKTNSKILPYSVVSYLEYQTTDNSKEDTILFSNYYELVLYLFMLENKLHLIQPSLLVKYPVNFESISKNNLISLFNNFNKVWK